MTASSSRPVDGTQQRDTLAATLFPSLVGAMELASVSLGDRFGLYRVVADADSVTAVDLAARSGIAEHTALEWLEQQVAGGILSVDAAAPSPPGRRFRLPPGHREMILDYRAMAFIASLLLSPPQ